MNAVPEKALRAWAEYLREMGLYDLYRTTNPRHVLPEAMLTRLRGDSATRSAAQPAQAVAVPLGVHNPVTAGLRPLNTRVVEGFAHSGARRTSMLPPGPPPPGSTLSAVRPDPPAAERSYFSAEQEAVPTLPPEFNAPMPKPQPLDSLFPMAATVSPAERPAALAQLRAEIGDCTRCPLAYAGRHHIVFGDGDPEAQLMFVGEGPGADEDASGIPFVGKAGQLLNNMIAAMGLGREQVYIANIVKCRPPGNRTPEFAEAATCSQFLLKQIDIVRPRVIVALGATAATYLLGVKQPLSALRGQWLSVREAKVAVTYHPAFLLRDPRQKAEAWKDLQRVMTELGLAPPSARKT